MRKEVVALVELGKIPESTASVDAVENFEATLRKITPPLNDDEAEMLIELFSPQCDDGFGMAWTVLHLVETSPTPFPKERPAGDAGYWVNLLYDRQR